MQAVQTLQLCCKLEGLKSCKLTLFSLNSNKPEPHHMECLDCSFSHYYSGTSPTLSSGEDPSNLIYSKIMGMAPSVDPCSQIALTLSQQSSPCVLPSPSRTVRRRCRSPLLPEPANFLPPRLGESLLSTLPSHLSPALSGSPIIISLMSSGYHYS